MSVIPIIIPAYKPDIKLLELMDVLCKANISQPIYIIDDGSGEESTSVFETLKTNISNGHYGNAFTRVKLLTNAVNLGKGRALKYAINEALVDFPELLGCVTIDSDGQHTVKDMTACMKALEDNENSLILGCRDFDLCNVPQKSKLGNKITRNVMKAFVGVSVSDTQTGLRAIPREFMKILLGEKGERYEFETNMLIATKEWNVDIVEVPIETVYIEENRGSHFNPIKDSLKIYALFGKFIVSSVSSSVIDLSMFYLFCRLLENVQLPILSYVVLATIISRTISSIYNFLVNYKAVFKSGNSMGKAGFRYAIVAIALMLISGFAVDAIHAIWPIAELAIKIPVDLLLFLASFWLQREFIY